MHRPPLITVDGPAASGKGTIAQRLAQHFGWHYLDSGALYRIVTQQALARGIDIADEAALVALTQRLTPRFEGDRIWVEDQDITLAIRTHEVSSCTSKVAALPGVRAALFQTQRALWQAPGLVADGRDMGTVVFPEADVKFFIVADVNVRAQRRFLQAQAQGQEANFEAILASLKERDQRDASRSTAPLKPALDAIEIDTSAMGIDEVMKKVISSVQSHLNLG